MAIWVLISLLSGEWSISSLVHQTDAIKDAMGTANTSNVSQLENDKTWDGLLPTPISLQRFLVSTPCLPSAGIAWYSVGIFLFLSLPALFLPSDSPFSNLLEGKKVYFLLLWIAFKFLVFLPKHPDMFLFNPLCMYHLALAQQSKYIWGHSEIRAQQGKGWVEITGKSQVPIFPRIAFGWLKTNFHHCTNCADYFLPLSWVQQFLGI